MSDHPLGKCAYKINEIRKWMKKRRKCEWNKKNEGKDKEMWGKKWMKRENEWKMTCSWWCTIGHEDLKRMKKKERKKEKESISEERRDELQRSFRFPPNLCVAHASSPEFPVDTCGRAGRCDRCVCGGWGVKEG